MEKGMYRHYKGKDYEVLGEVIHSETRERLVLYRPLYPVPELGPDPLFVRPKSMFFEMIEKDGKQIPRFTLLTEKA